MSLSSIIGSVSIVLGSCICSSVLMSLKCATQLKLIVVMQLVNKKHLAFLVFFNQSDILLSHT